MKAGFTLLEMLVTIAILVALAALISPATRMAHEYGQRTGCLSNMRQVGVGFRLYAQENEMQIPGRVTGKDPSGQPLHKWPILLNEYLNDPKVFVDPGDPKARQFTKDKLLADDRNNTSFFMNGFNDVGALDNEALSVRINQVERPGGLILLGQMIYGKGHFYMDLLEKPHGNQNDVLNKTAYQGGSNYIFADGSARFMKEEEYSDSMWLVNPTFEIPKL